MKCQYCQGLCIKKGRFKKRQLYRCKECSKYQRLEYYKQRISEAQKRMVLKLNKEGVGISSTSRLLKIAKSTVLKLLIGHAKKTKKIIYEESGQEYEVDELRTYIRRKDNECWIIYAINKRTKKVIDFVVGKRTKENIKKVIDRILMLNPRRIFTDRLNIYPGLIPKELHIALPYRINHIERKNLDLRKDLKCLNRHSICYSKSENMLTTKLKLYFFESCRSI